MGSVRVGAGLLTPVLVAFVAPTLAGAATPTWSIQSSPNRPGPSLGDLNGVSCVSATDCIAVGAVSGDPSESPLIESWNGSTWTIVPSPGEASGVNVLSGVSCTSESACDVDCVHGSGHLWDTYHRPNARRIVGW